MDDLLIGFGKAGFAHFEVAKALGFPIPVAVVRNPELYRKKFSNFKVEFVTLQECHFSSFKSIIIAAPTTTHQDLLSVIPSDVPILLEKPGTTGSMLPSRDRLYIGYNRRFYRLTEEIINLITNNEQGTISVTWVEPIENSNQAQIEYRLTENAVHILDLLLFLGTEFAPESINVLKIGNGFKVALEGAINNSWQVKLDLLFNIPAMSSFNAITDNLLLTASPLERTQVWSGVRPVSLNQERVPYLIERNIRYEFDEMTAFKPGYFNQYRAFLAATGRGPNNSNESAKGALCSPTEANRVFLLATQIFKLLI